MSLALALLLAHRPLLGSFLGAGYVLEEFLDQVHVGEDHAAAAIALETNGVEGITERVKCVSNAQAGLSGRAWGCEIMV